MIKTVRWYHLNTSLNSSQIVDNLTAKINGNHNLQSLHIVAVVLGGNNFFQIISMKLISGFPEHQLKNNILCSRNLATVTALWTMQLLRKHMDQNRSQMRINRQ